MFPSLFIEIDLIMPFRSTLSTLHNVWKFLSVLNFYSPVCTFLWWYFSLWFSFLSYTVWFITFLCRFFRHNLHSTLLPVYVSIYLHTKSSTLTFIGNPFIISLETWVSVTRDKKSITLQTSVL